MRIIALLARPRRIRHRAARQSGGKRGVGARVVSFISVATLIAALNPASVSAQEPVSDENLHQKWLEIQVDGSRPARKEFWQDLDIDQLHAFLGAGVEVAIADKRGWTPLHSAARYNSSPQVLAALLDAGAAVDSKDRSGDTPLHWAAAETTNVDIIEVLLDAGADVNARDKYGWLPIHTAAESNPGPDVIQVLLTAGAKCNKRAYFVLFRPVFLLKHNPDMSDIDKETAMALLEECD